MKRLAISLLCLVSIFSLLAQDRFYIEDFSIQPGETQTVSIMLDNSIEYTALQADISLPEGLTVAMEDDEYIFDLTDRKTRTHTISSNLLSSGAIRILIASPKKTVFNGNSGALVTFDVIADANITGPKVITLSNVIASETNSTTHALPETTCNVTVVKLATSITIDNTEAVMTEGETLQLTATVLPEDATDKSVTWSSNDETVATVNDNGLVTAIAPGTATITVTTVDGTAITATCEITVRQLVTSLTLNPTSAEMIVGETLQLSATALPENATDKSVTWQTGNDAVATVDATGKVTAVGPGTATITASTVDGTNLSASCEVTVSEPAMCPLLELNEKAVRLQPTNTCQLAVTTVGAGNVNWTSSDPTIASVDDNGVVTALKDGIAIITATTGNGASAWCAVFSYLHGDVNEDNVVDVSDVNIIVNIILGKN